ncbi:hypothetical protein [Streptomyces sp. NBC_01089]|uniref:hypothetical protein n=1 Tax=Streptomyces sp. NBC_01089 TaxID=2903747 RepID=UPI00386D60AB
MGQQREGCSAWEGSFPDTGPAEGGCDGGTAPRTPARSSAARTIHARRYCRSWTDQKLNGSSPHSPHARPASPCSWASRPPPSAETFCGSHSVDGAIWTEYTQTPGVQQSLGCPTSDELGFPDGVGIRQQFQNATVYWSPGTGAHAVHGNIGWWWGQYGYELPTADVPRGVLLPQHQRWALRRSHDGNRRWWRACSLRRTDTFGETHGVSGHDSSGPMNHPGNSPRCDADEQDLGQGQARAGSSAAVPVK